MGQRQNGWKSKGSGSARRQKMDRSLQWKRKGHRNPGGLRKDPRSHSRSHQNSGVLAAIGNPVNEIGLPDCPAR